VMPGDVVLGDRTGVVFIPPHLVEAVAVEALRRSSAVGGL
jgi:regulator of RNase E activity RraA